MKLFILVLVLTISGINVYSQSYALHFDGTDDYVVIPDDDALDLTSNYTIEAWIKPHVFGQIKGIISKYHTSASNGFYVRLSLNSPYTGVSIDGTYTPNGVLSADTWYHVAATNEGGSIRNIYINGVKQTLTGTATVKNVNSDPVRIASDYGGRYFNGTIDEIRIWNYVRTQQQITENKDIELSGNGAGLVAYYKMNEGIGTVLNDNQTAGLHDGTLTNGPVWVAGKTLGALPVELTSFNGVASAQKVNLNWQTATEVNNYGFEIERSTVGTSRDLSLQWEKIGFIEGSGNSNSPKEYSFTDGTAPSGTVQYRLKQIDTDGKFEYSDIVEVEVNNILTEFALFQNYPNPFNPNTTIKFALPLDSKVVLEVYTTLGERVAELVNKDMAAGYHLVQLNGSGLASGTYFYILKSGKYMETKKMVLIR